MKDSKDARQMNWNRRFAPAALVLAASAALLSLHHDQLIPEDQEKPLEKTPAVSALLISMATSGFTHIDLSARGEDLHGTVSRP